MANFSVSSSKNSQLRGGEGKRSILLLTRQRSAGFALTEALTSEGYRVSVAAEIDDALRQIRSDGCCSVVIDADRRGADACRKLREVFDAVIIAISARKDEKEKIALLDAGADDCLTKPFGVLELLARIRAKLRRYERESKRALLRQTEK